MSLMCMMALSLRTLMIVFDVLMSVFGVVDVSLMSLMPLMFNVFDDCFWMSLMSKSRLWCPKKVCKISFGCRVGHEFIFQFNIYHHGT